MPVYYPPPIYGPTRDDLLGLPAGTATCHRCGASVLWAIDGRPGDRPQNRDGTAHHQTCDIPDRGDPEMNARATAMPPPAAVSPPTGPTLTVTVGPRNAYTDPESGLRYYRWGDRDLPSVTSIRRMAGLPHGLHQWAIGKVIDAAIDRHRDIGERLATGDPAAVALIRHELRAAATAERDAAASLGTAVHDAAAAGLTLDEVSSAIAPRLRQFYDWLAKSSAEILGSEFQCWNLELGYAGTADALVRLRDGSVWLVDYKTGKGVYGEFALQLIAYSMAEFVGEDGVVNDDLTALLHQISGMAILHLGGDGWEFRAIEADPATWSAFRGLLAFAVWMKEHGTADSITTAIRGSGT